ncbi:hypothetical protein FTW19_13230 [Terriglobus albidus]|uniref:Uncharacterized protein n=1 Tax=Terriglobus albidus TaxID=1592106 RepID=A0A5B9EB18_9BACT|nr:hypothetical protein [Terriglobus albidus]QEE28874.1 hypothetical protein FTW19_13230 [Terriglobus albidus]
MRRCAYPGLPSRAAIPRSQRELRSALLPPGNTTHRIVVCELPNFAAAVFDYVNLEALCNACTVGIATRVSVHSPASTVFLNPVFSIAATEFL